MEEPKKQIKVIVALLVALIALCGGMFFLPSPLSPVASTDPPQHNKIRDALSGDLSVQFTQTFGGSNDETLNEVFFFYDKFYIFGNTQSDDYDFESQSSGAYLAIINSYGKTESFITFGGELVSATLFENGFLLSLKRTNSFLLNIDLNGKILKSVEIKDIEPIDLYSFDSGIIFIGCQTKPSGQKVLYSISYDKNLNFMSEGVTDEIFNLDYLCCFVLDQPYFIATATSDISSNLCIGNFSGKSNYFPLERPYKVLDFWYNSEYVFLCSDDKTTFLLSVSNDYQTVDKKIIGESSTGGKLFYLNGYYAFLDDTTLFVNETITEKDRADNAIFWQNYIYAIFSEGGYTRLTAYNENGIAGRITMPLNCVNPIPLATDNGFYIFCLTEGTFGGKDVTMTKAAY